MALDQPDDHPKKEKKRKRKKKKRKETSPLCFRHFNTLIWNGIIWRLAISQHDTDKMSYSYIYILAQLLCRCKINCYFLKILQYKKQIRYKTELYGNVRDVQSVQFPWSYKVITMFNVAYFFHGSVFF
jgi:hypothetical protein